MCGVVEQWRIRRTCPVLWAQSCDKKKYRWTSLINWLRFSTPTLLQSWAPLQQYTCRQVLGSYCPITDICCHTVSICPRLRSLILQMNVFLKWLDFMTHCLCCSLQIIVHQLVNSLLLLFTGWEWLWWPYHRSGHPGQDEKCLCFSECVKLTGTWWVFLTVAVVLAVMGSQTCYLFIHIKSFPCLLQHNLTLGIWLNSSMCLC